MLLLGDFSIFKGICAYLSQSFIMCIIIHRGQLIGFPLDSMATDLANISRRIGSLRLMRAWSSGFGWRCAQGGLSPSDNVGFGALRVTS